MIVLKQRKEVIVIKQEDHAEFAAFLLERWSDHGFNRNPQRDRIIEVTRLHDNGWREFDASPRLLANGLPVDFKNITPEEIFEIWMRGSRRYLDTDPWVALIITHHAYSLHEHNHNRRGVWKDFFKMLAVQRGELRDRLGLTHNDVEHVYSFLRMADWFSLNFCCNPKLGAARPAQYAGYKVRREENAFLFRPYPFDERGIRYELPYYKLNPEGYEDEKAIRKDLKKPEMMEILLTPLEF